jgi:hypothetical protein
MELVEPPPPFFFLSFILNTQGLSYGSYYYRTLLILVQLDILYRLLIGVTEVRFYSLESFLHLNTLYSNVAL